MAVSSGTSSAVTSRSSREAFRDGQGRRLVDAALPISQTRSPSTSLRQDLRYTILAPLLFLVCCLRLSGRSDPYWYVVHPHYFNRQKAKAVAMGCQLSFVLQRFPACTSLFCVHSNQKKVGPVAGTVTRDTLPVTTVSCNSNATTQESVFLRLRPTAPTPTHTSSGVRAASSLPPSAGAPTTRAPGIPLGEHATLSLLSTCKP